jgi:hypothetical protein
MAEANKHGCFNREPFKKFYFVFDGYLDEERTRPKTKRIANVFADVCNYTKDAECEGCKHNTPKV